MKPLKIFYSCSDQWFGGLYLSILSILRRSKSTFDFCVFVADMRNIKKKAFNFAKQYGSITKEHLSALEKMIKSFNPENKLTIIDCGEKYCKLLDNKNLDVKQYSPYTIFRLFIEDYEWFNGKVLYLDVDTMANDDVTKVFDVNINNFEVAVAHDKFATIDPEHMFNAGVMLINVDMVKKTKSFSKALEYFIKYRPGLADQASLMHSLTKIKFFDDEYRYNYQDVSIAKDTIIKHFLNAKRKLFWKAGIRNWHPWRVKYLLHLHNWDEDYKIYKKAKKTW